MTSEATECDETLDDDGVSDHDIVAAGEQEANEVDPVADRALLRKLEQMNY